MVHEVTSETERYGLYWLVVYMRLHNPNATHIHVVAADIPGSLANRCAKVVSLFAGRGSAHTSAGRPLASLRFHVDIPVR